MQKNTIEEILNDKTLFWQYILSGTCRYCKAFKNKQVEEPSPSIEEIQKEANMSEKERRVLEIKRKLAQKRKCVTNVTQNEFKCSQDLCNKIEYMEDFDYEAIKSGLKENIDFWAKRKYNVYGEFDGSKYWICFEKDNVVVRYCNSTEELDSSHLLGAVQIVRFGEFIKIINEDVKNFTDTLK